MEAKIKIAIPEQWQEYKEIRLKALKTDPTAFGASYEEEAEYSPDKWKTKLTDPDKRTYLAWIDDKPVALTTVRFEIPKNVEHLATIYSVFTDPEFRNQGIGTKLLNKVLDDLHKNPKTIKVRLSVNEAHKVAKNMYLKLGFFQEGILKKEMKIDNVYYDQAQMALIFEDKI